MTYPSPIHLAVRRILGLSAALLALVCFAQTAPERILFDVQAGEAKPMLHRFATQARREIIFSTEAVASIRTNAVKGEMTPQEAINLMLADTGLVGAQDSKTGAFAIRPDPETASKNGARATPTGVRPKTLDGSKTETLVLNPFVVRTDRDDGFVASSSLAGGRLATDLRDTPVAYSVVTRDFIDAVGITDFAEAAQWTPNTVVAVFAGGTANDVSNDSYNYTVRGATNGRPQRNFFLYYSPMDSYAIDRYDFGRGPNAILFGNGSLGGVSSSTTKQARPDRAFTTITAGYGSWNKLRGTLDINQPVNDRLAVRAAAMWTDGEGWKDYQFQKSKAMFLTGTYKLTENTSIRLETEFGNESRNNTYSNIVDSLAGWDGRTTYHGTLATRPVNGDAIGVNLRPASYWLYDQFSGQNAVMNYQGDPNTLSANANQNVPIAGLIQGPPPTATTPGNPSFGANGSTLLYAQALPANVYANAIAGSAFRTPDPGFTTAQDVPTLQQRFKDFQLTVDHRIGSVFLQMAVDHNRTTQLVNTPDVRNANIVYVDINDLLPNGANNPHFLQPYTDAFIRTYKDERNSDAIRVAIGTSRNFGRWGNYSMNMLGGYTISDVNKIGVWNASIAQNLDHRRWGASGGSLPSTDRIQIRNYWNETERPYAVPSTVRLIDPVTQVDKTITPIMALENDRSDSAQAVRSIYTYGIAAMTAKYWKERIVFLGAIRGDNFYNYTRQQINGGDYSPTTWDGRTAYFKTKAPDDYATLSYTVKNSNGVALGAPVPADTRPRDANGNRLAQYANDRFRDDYNGPVTDKSVFTPSVGGIFHVTPWFSPFINYAETFNPPAIIQRLDSSFLPPTVANGVDYGVRFSLLKGRVNMSVLQYENSEVNNAVDPNVQGNINAILSAAPLPSLNNGSTIGRNLQQVPNVPGVVRDLQDRTSKGKEVEIVANLTKAWRLTFNLGFPKIFVKNGFPDTRKYLEGNDAVFRKIVADAGVIITTSASDPVGTATVDSSIPVNQRSADANAVVNAWNGLRNTRVGFASTTAARLTQDQSTMNIYTDYAFRSGKLRGLRVGAGWQYRGPLIIGNLGGRTIVDPANPARAIDDPTVGSNDPYRAPSWSNVVVNVNYVYPLARNRELSFQLRVDNALNDRDPLWAGGTATRPTNGDYSSPARDVVPSNFALRTPIGFTLTTTLKF